MEVKTAVLNQQPIFNMLKQSKLHNRLSHAYLFYGDEGVGKKEMAYALACLLYCPNGGCFECEVCQTILKGQHINVDYIGIEKDKTMISKEQITSLQEEFSKTSLVDGSRVYIVDGIDTASVAAQNSLLKFIEEPANKESTIGIFLAKELSNIVPTIISRCALQHFKAFPLDKNVEILCDKGISELDAILCCSLTNHIGEAEQFATSEDFLKQKKLFLEFIDILKAKDAVMFYLNYSGYYSAGNNLTFLLEWLLLFIEDAAIAKTSEDDLILKPLYDKIISYRNKNENSLKNKLKLVLDLFDRLKYNVSAKNVFHELITKMI